MFTLASVPEVAATANAEASEPFQYVFLCCPQMYFFLALLTTSCAPLSHSSRANISSRSPKLNPLAFTPNVIASLFSLDIYR